ncbi:hypothetical protein [Winogradskya humida]|uniref:Uncharacterized protein n=1 Tax=Winogradskya humida TaxID=113566 RepID=A0ABQ3ZLK5_9ACTN|nr:hypothetical protein [Actinoplanes humidus]GIE19466.1 hypothetical protein Ahu01nite_025680 [Actinoplanes humidus]
MDTLDVILTVAKIAVALLWWVMSVMQLVRARRTPGPDVVWRGNLLPEGRLMAYAGFFFSGFWTLYVIYDFVENNTVQLALMIGGIAMIGAGIVMFSVRNRRIKARAAATD